MPQTIKGKHTTAEVTIDAVEQDCISQLYTIVNHPAFTHKIVVMPDCHSGKGSVIGFTMPATSKIVPNVIGVDIGCGIVATRIESDKDFDFEKIDTTIRNNVPLGFSACEKKRVDIDTEFPGREKYWRELCKKIGTEEGKVERAIGTLGGGNHFIEIGEDTQEVYWLTIHTGSRNFGLKIAQHYQNIAIESIKKSHKYEFKKIVDEIVARTATHDREQEIQKARDQFGIGASHELAWLEGDDANEYITAMYFAQEYAALNRKTIVKTICEKCGFTPIDTIESIHNYIDPHDNIIRKGAIRSYKGERMIIPFNMRDGILICEGKSNPEWNYSAPHGAGRVMSRSNAKKTLALDRFKNQMKGVYSTSISQDTLDESPDAYKHAEFIELAIEPTATIIDRIKPIYSLKAGGE